MAVLAVGGARGSTLTGVTSVAAGESHSLALTPSGVFAWGNNGYGELGDDSNGASLTPVQVLGVGGAGTLTGVTSIAAGQHHSLAVTPSGVFAWGQNDAGQLGDGRNSSRSAPVQVVGVDGSGVLTGVTSIAAGFNHSLALTPTGVFAWGYNDDGQLGNNDPFHLDSSTPVQVLGEGGSGVLTGVTSIAAGEYHSLAITPTGVNAWGSNYRGQLGDGTTAPRSTPVLGANFLPLSALVTSLAATGLSNGNNVWSITTPAGSEGIASILATASLFAGTTAATPATVSWNAGTFTYR